MRTLTMAFAAGAAAAVLAGSAVGQTIYVYRDAYPAAAPPVIYDPAAPTVIYEPATPTERLYVDRPYYGYESYYVWDPVLMRYEPRYRYRVVDNSGRSYPVTAQESARLYGYPYGFDGNPGYLTWDGRRIAIASDRGLTRDSNPDDYSSGHYNPKP
jgi:hypothetical protein